MEKKYCIDCKHFHFDGGCPDYSDVTTGENVEVCCRKEHWELDVTRDTEEEFRTYMRTASGCEDFEECE